MAIAFGLVADHAVQRVDRLVGEQAGQAQDQIPEGWCDHTVGEIFGQRLDRPTADTMFVERCGVPADDVADRGASGLDPIAFQRRGHRVPVIVKAALGH